MSMTYAGNRYRGSSASLSNALSLTLSGTVQKWSLLVLRIAMDNAASGGPGSIDIESGGGANTWSTFSVNRNPAGANTGTSLWAAWTIVEDTALSNILVRFYTDATHSTTQFVQAKAGMGDEFTGVNRADPVIATFNDVGTGLNLDVPLGTWNADRLLVGMLSLEAPETAQINDNGGAQGGMFWAALSQEGTTLATADSNQVTYGRYKITTVTASGHEWDLDFNGDSWDWASRVMVFDHQPVPEGDIAANLPGLNQGLEAQVAVEGDVTAALPALTAELEGESHRLSAVVDAQLPSVSAILSGRVRPGLPPIDIRPGRTPLRWFTSPVRWREL